MIADEKYIFKSATKQKLFILIGVGLLLFGLGVYMAMNSGRHEGAEKHASEEVAKSLLASAEPKQHGEAHDAHGGAAEAHHGSPTWLKRIYTSLWHNNVFFAGIGIIGLFFTTNQRTNIKIPAKGIQ